ncbi:MAG: histidine kinase dimerization/phosphoacceptor domain -containing protein [Spirochaetia bacterium]
MDPIMPLIATTLAASGLLAVVHAYLFRSEASFALGIWTVAWGLYALRFVAAMGMEAWPGAVMFVWFHQVASLMSAVFLLWGAVSHTSGKAALPRLWVLCSAVLVVWVTIALGLGVSRPIVFTPVFVFLGFSNFAIAAAYIRTPTLGRQSRVFIATVFILWGLHKLDYPLLRGLPDAALWGYALGAIFTMAAGVGLLTAYLERARESASNHRKRFETLVDSLDDVVFTLDADARYTGIFGSWVRETEGAELTFLGKSGTEIYGLQEGAIHEEMAMKAIAENRAVTYEWSRPRADETVRYSQTTVSPMRTRSDSSHQLVGISRDITELKNTQQSLERGVREKSTLLREVHHRVKNNLQIIVSLLRLQSKYFDDAATRRAFEDTMGRVASMAAVHERLYESADLTSVSFDAYLGELSQEILALHVMREEMPELRLHTDKLELDVATAIPLGLITTELISNACKHAFYGGADDRLSVRLNRQGAEIVLSVADNGPGFGQEFAPQYSGSLGMSLISALCDQLGATFEWESDNGATFRVRVPMGAKTAYAGELESPEGTYRSAAAAPEPPK